MFESLFSTAAYVNKIAQKAFNRVAYLTRSEQNTLRQIYDNHSYCDVLSEVTSELLEERVLW